MKTVKYYITAYLSDGIISSKMEVSKTKFDKQYKSVLDQFNNQITDSEFEVDKSIYVHDYETYTAEIISFSYSICSLDFTTLVCKDGYYFKK